jgi:co-chaperonin GroES (HSP10)
MPEKETQTDSGIYVPAEQKSTTRSRVVAISKYLPSYRNKQLFKNNDVKIGDIIHSEDHFQIELDKTVSSTTKFVRVLNSSILYIEN